MVVAIGGAIPLKLHFDDLLNSEVLASEPPADLETGDRDDDPTLGSSAADPGFAATEIVASTQADEETGDDPAGPQTAIATSVDEDAEGEDTTEEDGDGDAGGLVEVFEPDPTVWSDPAGSGRPWSDLGAVEGLLTFRGNPTRTFHGRGPVPTDPAILWSFRVGCSNSSVGGEPKEWCGSGWTGQPALFRLPTTGDWTLAFGAYNRNVNFLNPETGLLTLAPYRTGDIIKGSVTIDPDGFPLLYTGSRDNFFHVVSLDGPSPQSLWQLSSDSTEPTLWNNDWDGSALVVDDYLFIGGENGRFYIVRLNRAYDDDGRVTVDPEVVFSTESWDGELLSAIGDLEASVENSVAISGDVVYFSNSGGLVQGWDISGLDEGVEPERVFRYWTGDDTDASIVVDAEGMLYLGSEYQRLNARSRDLGQILKLDPSKPDDPLVWGRQAREGPGSGVWATPALHEDLVIVATNEGEVLGLDRETGEDRWRLSLDGPLWSSPVVVDDTLIQADCAGFLHAFDLGSDDPTPPELWSVELGGCLESTPAVWDGRIFVGSRSGDFFAVGD